jgi:putative tryptophan/tyrosine transport system substrate-binding protein
VSVSRRQFVRAGGAAGLGLLAGCGFQAQSPQHGAKVPRLGFLEQNQNPVGDSLSEAFRQGLRELGYVEGENVIIEWRAAGPSPERLSVLAAELVQLPVDLIVVRGNEPAQAAKDASPTIPVVMALAGDPVGTGLVASLAHPGGQVTGLTAIAPQLAGKRLELLKDAVPELSRVGTFWNPSLPPHLPEFDETEIAAAALGLQLQSLEVRSPADFAPAFAATLAERAQALLVFTGGLNSGQAPRITEFALQHHLPTMYALREHADAGGLMAYGPSYLAMHRRAAYYVDRILKGTSPADLPVEQPREFDFVVNLRTAQALGLTIPQHVLLQATEVLQ